jgi:PqqD family protein of HPr-rel-A system
VTPRRRPRVHGVEVDSESVLYDEKSGRLHLLNSSASAVWWLIDGKRSVDALVAAVADRLSTDTSPAVVRDDVLRLLEMLGSEGLIDFVAPRRSHDG